MYQSLYRKYRPQTFAEVYGQDAISQTLTNAIILDRVAHAYLFSGSRGTGKTTSAKLLAKALNCTNIIDGKICDECENCRMIKENNHPDIIEIDAASNNGVDEVRDLIEKVKYAPIKGRKKVYIIDEVHMMSQGAFNALLKTLEEPPDHVVFILATTEQHKVLPTIKSRCQKFVFKKIKDSDIVACLSDILDKEECSYDTRALEIIASLADGGMRDALSLLEQVMIYSNNDISVEKVNESLDLISKDKIVELFNYIIDKNLDQTLEYVVKLDEGSVDYHQVMNEIVKMSLQELLEAKRIKDEDKAKYLLNMIEKFDESIERLRYDNSRRLYLDLAIIKTINFNQKNQIISDGTNVKEDAIKKVESIINEETIKEEVKEEVEEIIEVKEELESIQNEFVEVNHEENEEVNYDLPVIDEDELMNVLVQATRDDLNFVKDKWENISDYLLNINTKKEAGLLIESKPVAASDNAIIVVCAHSVEVSLINSVNNIPNIQNFVDKVMKQPRFCFAISQEEWQVLKDKYVKLRQVNNLPKAKEVLRDVALNRVKITEKKIDNVLEEGKELFADKLIIRKED